MRALLAELRRRNVFRVALGYVVVAWLVLQVVSVVAPMLELPAWISRAILLLLVAGFPISLVLAWAFELTPDGIQRADEPSGAVPAQAAVSAGRKLDFLIIGALCAALGYFVWQRFDAAPMTQSGPSTEDNAADSIQTLAVLPFVNLSSDPEQDYFSDGLSEELLNQLAQIAGLRVTGRTSAFVFKGHNEDLRTIGEKLGVKHILEGSVRKAGNRLRITAQLVSANDGYHLWSETFDRELNDIFAIQESVASAVTRALGITLGVGDSGRAAGGTTNLEAYDKYLRARALFYQSGSLERAAEIYREALTLDPQFALAWYGLYTAFGYSLIANADDADARRAMDQASARLVDLTPEAWWTQAMRTDQYLLQHRWSEAEAAANATLAAASSSDVDALIVYATFLMYVGRINEAVDVLQRARAADPLSLRVSGLLQLFLDVAGRPDDADAEFVRSKDLAGGHARWEWAALLRTWARDDKDPAAFKIQFRRYLQDWHQGRSLDSVLFDSLEQPEAARDALRQAYEEPQFQLAGNMTAIFLYADLFGDEDLTLTAMRHAFVDLDKVNFEGLWWPFVTNVRTDPRFKDIVRDIGLVDYWRAKGNWGDFARPLGTDDFEVYR